MYYAVSLFFYSERADGIEPLWEEQIILINASEEEEAKKKSESLALKNESEYLVNSGVTVKWRFFKVERVFLISEELGEGVEIFSRCLRDSEAKSLLTPFD